ncbi:MAG: histidine kinase dimerization/phosphoacceptor domain-containing protein [Comamonadaceae bacterium]|nr:histidine kinase dimerization/phosphoacceptor domain-containing protein [Comamonadaceae bacterium]
MLLRAQREWPDALVKRLQLVAQVFANALARRAPRPEAAEERVAPGGGRRARRPRVLRGGLRRAASPTSTTGSASSAAFPPTGEQGLAGPAVLDGAPASRRPRPRARSAPSDCTTGGWSGSPSNIATCTRPQGERWIHHLARVARRDAAGRTLQSFGVLRDITQRPSGPRRRLRDLSRRLIRAHEDERALLARELHDDVTQRLAVLAIDVGRAELAAPDGAQAEAMRSVRDGARAPQRGHPLAGLPAAPVGPGGARPGRGAAGGMRTARSPGPARRGDGPRVRCRRRSARRRRCACSAWRRRR